MKISVIIPVYNTERYVAEAIDSVLAQTRPPDEVIVIDDGSTDGTPAVLESFGTRVIAVHQEHAGPSKALNTGIAHATGNYLAFNDADDLWLPEKLKQQCDFLTEQPDIEAAFGMVRQFVSPDWHDSGGLPGETAPDQLGIGRLTMLIRRNAFERIGSFDESMRFVDFVDWYGRAQVLGLRTHMLPDVLGLRRLHANNTGRIHGQAQRQEDLVALKRMLDLRRRRNEKA